MTEQTLELALLLPRAAECGGCVDEVGRELQRLDGIHGVEPDVSRGLLRVAFDEQRLSGGDVETFARRAGALAHCEEHCPLAVHEHGPLDLSRPLAGENGHERRVLHVTGMDCADCAVKLQGALRRERGVRSADVNFGAATLASPSTRTRRRCPRCTAPSAGSATTRSSGARPRPGGPARRRQRRAPGAGSGSRSPAPSPRSSPARSPSPASSRWRQPRRRRPGSSAPPWSAAACTSPAPPSSACAAVRST